MKTEKFVLENGFETLFLKRNYSPGISIQLWVKAGSRNEVPGITGISHMLEHMMFKGSKKYGPQAHAQLIQANGGELNAFTSNDRTVYYDNLPPEKLSLGLDLESDRFLRLSLDEKEFQTERQVVYEERKMRTDNSPYGKAMEMLFALTFIAHPYHWPVIGWESDILSWTIDDLRAYYKKFYSPKNVFLIIAGNFDKEKAKLLVEKKFGKWKKVELDDLRIPKEPKQNGERFTEIKMRVELPFVFSAYRTPPYGSKEALVFDIAERILSGGESSRIYRKLVYDTQLALSAGGGVYSFLDYGLFFVYGILNREKDFNSMKKALFEEVEGFFSGSIKEEELEKAKNQLKAELTKSTEKTFSHGMLVGESYFYTGNPDFYLKKANLYDPITLNDFKEVGEKFISEIKRNTVIIKPEEKR